MPTLNVDVPAGVGPGDTVEFADPAGALLSAVVPAGCTEGMTFEVNTFADGWLEEILESLVQDNFVRVLDGFLGRECGKFLAAGADGYSLEQSGVHEKYVRFYEARIESHLRKACVAPGEFMEALLAADAATDPGQASLVTSLLLVQDFAAFAQMMTQRAMESTSV